MNKTTQIWLIASAALILIGGILFAGTMTSLKWDFRKLNTTHYETNQHTLTETFHSIRIETDTANVQLIPSPEGNCTITCYEEKNLKHTVEVKDEVLYIHYTDHQKWYKHIGINFETTKLTIALPAAQYKDLFLHQSTGDLEIAKEFSFENLDVACSTGDTCIYANVTGTLTAKASTGDIRLENIAVGSATITVSTGKITASNLVCKDNLEISVSSGNTQLSNIRCKALLSTGNTGRITLKDVVALESFSIKRTTGDVELEGCDAATIEIKTSTGNVDGTLLTEKVFITSTSTGRINVPHTTTGGVCKITTNTGDINIEI